MDIEEEIEWARRVGCLKGALISERKTMTRLDQEANILALEISLVSLGVSDKDFDSAIDAYHENLDKRHNCLMLMHALCRAIDEQDSVN